VAKDNNSWFLPSEPASELFVQRVRVHNVMNEKFAAIQFDYFRLPEMKTRIVYISQDRRYRSNLLKLKN